MRHIFHGSKAFFIISQFEKHPILIWVSGKCIGFKVGRSQHLQDVLDEGPFSSEETAALVYLHIGVHGFIEVTIQVIGLSHHRSILEELAATKINSERIDLKFTSLTQVFLDLVERPDIQ